MFEYGDEQVIKIASERAASLQKVKGRWPYGSLQHEAHMYRICGPVTRGFYKVLPAFYGEGVLDGKPCILLERLEPCRSRVIPELAMLEAVHQMHKQGVVHGDLRFQNVMVTASGRVCASLPRESSDCGSRLGNLAAIDRTIRNYSIYFPGHQPGNSARFPNHDVDKKNLIVVTKAHQFQH